MSVVSYNGVTLPYANITRFTQEGVYDDTGNTDLILYKFDIEVQAVVDVSYVSTIAPDLAGGFTLNAADIMDVVRKRLMTPRRTLSVKFNGVELIPNVAANAGTVDAANGPKPQSISHPVLTNDSFLLSYRIVAHYWDNPGITRVTSPIVSQNKGTNPVLYNRWSESVDIDSCNYTRKTRMGKFLIRSDNASAALADTLRSQMAIVGVLPGFVRESSKYTVTPDGLGIQYQVVDKEVFKMPPFPAFEASGQYHETTSNIGTMRWGRCRVHLKGSKDVDQLQLLSVAMAVVTQKLNLLGARTKDGSTVIAILQSSSIMVDLYKNEVEVEMMCRMKPDTVGSPGGKGRKAGLAGFTFGQHYAKTPLSDGEGPDGRGVQPAYLDRGSASVLLQAAAYYDPSLATTLNRRSGQMTRGVVPGTAGVNKET